MLRPNATSFYATNRGAAHVSSCFWRWLRKASSRLLRIQRPSPLSCNTFRSPALSLARPCVSVCRGDSEW